MFYMKNDYLFIEGNPFGKRAGEQPFFRKVCPSKQVNILI